VVIPDDDQGADMRKIWIGLACIAVIVAKPAFAQESAQQSSGRIDLDAVSEGQFPYFVAATIPFVDTDSQCPERRETLRFSEGILRLVDFLPAGVSVVGPSGEKIFGFGPANAARHSGPFWQETSKPADDHTWQLDLAASNCRMDIDIRQQVRRENGWISLRLPLEESEILLREMQQRLRDIEKGRPPRELTPREKEAADRMRRRLNALSTSGALGDAATGVRAVVFRDRPQTCLEALGDYQIDQKGVVFSFFTPLPGDLNRFVMERVDPDPSHGRLYFTRGDCRWELTISRSVLRGNEWVALPLAPVRPKRDDDKSTHSDT
jgi:hypothetical protein